MSAHLTETEDEPLILHFGSILKKISEHDFFEFCQLHECLRIERTGEGDVIILPLAGAQNSIRRAALTASFGVWTKQNGSGQPFGALTGFILPNGALRAPYLSWIRNERWEALPDEAREEFAPLCPDFVAEICSETDSLKSFQVKMEEYIANGAQLGWLFDAKDKKVYVYRPQADVEILDNPQTLSGEPLLRGFVLSVPEIWD